MTIMTDPLTGRINDPRDAFGSLSSLINREPPGTYYGQAARAAVVRLWEVWQDQMTIVEDTNVVPGDVVIDILVGGIHGAWYVQDHHAGMFTCRRLSDGYEAIMPLTNAKWRQCRG